MTTFRTTALIILLAFAFALSDPAADRSAGTRDATQQVDPSVKPGDDFYRYANGGWLKSAVIPEGQSSFDTRAILVARTSQRVRDLIQGAAES